MSPAAEAQSLEASGEAQQEALAQSKARSVIKYSPDEIFQKSWQVRVEELERGNPSRSCLSLLRPSTSAST